MAKKTLQSYLVSLGFNIDPQSYKKFKDALAVTAKQMEEVGVIAAEAATALTAGVTKIASNLERLYFMSQRTGASANNIKAFEYGARQVGISADQAASALENMASSLRMNPGLIGMLKSLNINPDQDKVKVLMDLVDRLRRMPFYQGARVAQMFGIDEGTLVMLEKNFDELKKYEDERARIAGQAGIDANQMASASHHFMQSLRGLEERLGVLWDLAASRLLPVGEKLIGWLDSVIDYFIRADRATDGWSSKLVALVSALGGAMGAMKGVKSVLSLLGIGRAAGGAAAAGQGAAKVASRGLGGAFAVGALGGFLAKWGIDIKAGEYQARADAGKDLSSVQEKFLQSVRNKYTQVTGKSDYGSPEFWKWVKENTAYNAIIEGKTKPGVNVAMGGPGPQGSQPTPGDGVVWGNNPGNLRLWGNAMRVDRGGIGKFAVFGSALEGLSAMAGQLLRYGSRGVDTIRSIIGTYAPSSENNTAAYITDISKRLGIAADKHLNLRDPGTLTSLMAAMIHHEQGFDPYNMNMLREAANFRFAQDAGKTVRLDQKTEITVNGAGDPKQVADNVVKGQARVNGDLIRNLAGATN